MCKGIRGYLWNLRLVKEKETYSIGRGKCYIYCKLCVKELELEAACRTYRVAKKT